MNSRHGSADALRRACRHRDAGLVRARWTVGRVRADLRRSLPGVLCDGAISHRGARSSDAFSSHSARTFAVWGHGWVPPHAIAVTGNLTVTHQTSLGFLYLGPNAANNPTRSTLNFPVGDDRANAVTVALGAGGTLSATYAAPTLGPSAQVIFDVTGYFTPDSTGATYHSLTPTRLLDT